jgi:peptidoglycan-associated lipoprotein
MAKDVIVLDSSAKDFHAKIYYAKKNEETGVWGKPEALKANINRPEIHNVNVSISPDGNKLYFNRQVLQGNEVVESQLFYSVGGDGAWKGAKEVVGIDPEYRARHPFPGELYGREVLFFSSDIPGGFGGADLYYAPQKSEGVYGDPVNLGPKINTLGDEVTPYYYNGTLYFSSNMHPGLGGYDIFYSFWNGQNWSDPLNMSKGFNSPQDDQYFRLDADGYNGLLTSNRPAGKSVRAKTCCEDIYSFTIEKIKADLVVGTFNSGRQALKGVTVMIIPKPGGDPQTIQNDKGNKFDFKLELEKSYRIIATHPNHFPDTAVINTLNLKANKSFTQRLYLKPIPIPVPEYDTILSEKAIVMENILYEYGDDKILPTAEPDLNFLLEIMNQYPDLIIELSSHTDNRGNDDFNKALSQRRAESAKQWLLKKGINQTRIKAVGNGENVPKVVDDRLANKHPEFLPGDVFSGEYINKLETEEDKELAHALNRRTEFKIIGGPKVITVKSTRLLKREATTAADKSTGALKPRGDSIPSIHPFSTLAGKKIYKGVPILDFTVRETNFGTVTRGEKREFTYVFQNIGDTKAEIDLISACECTTTEYNAQSIPPGGKGTIKVIFDSKDKVQGETIVIDIFLKNTEPGTERPIIEKLKYQFDIK